MTARRPTIRQMLPVGLIVGSAFALVGGLLLWALGRPDSAPLFAGLFFVWGGILGLMPALLRP